MASRAFGRAMRLEWALDPDVVYLNHGTVGAPPRRVLAAQQAIRDEVERQPARYLLRELSAVRVGRPSGEKPRLRVAADRVAEFLGVRGDDLVFVDNVTAGANAVLRSFDLHAGDEILILDHAYGGVAKAAEFAARERRATVRTVAVPWPPVPATIVERVAAAIGPRSRLAVIDHVTAESALVLPLAEIAAACRARGVAVLVDGAHAPGAIPVDVGALGVDWYVANLHKWAWAPRSCGVLWAAPARQTGLHPPVVSWGLDQGFTTEFDWPGTRDPSPALAAPAAIAFMRELGVEAVQGWNHALAWRAGTLLAERWSTELVQREDQIGTMITVPAPERFGGAPEDAARLRDALLFEDGIEVQVHAHQGRVRIRVSAQIYNDEEDVDRLAEAVARRG
jgi:isopenicillin-N epimerase